MSRKGKKKRQQQRKNTQKQKKANAKKNIPDAKTPPHAAPVVEETEELPTENGCTTRRWRVVGLANLRNTCYFNSVLQLLLSSTVLQDHFADLESQGAFVQSSLTAAMTELFTTARSSSEKRIQVKPSRVLGAVRTVEPLFKSRGQHDAHELLITLLHHLVEEAKSHSNPNWMSENLAGKLISKITCKKCGYSKSREEDLLVLSVAVTKDTATSPPVPVSHAIRSESLGSDVVERVDTGALRHLQPNGDESSIQNNFLYDSASETLQTDDPEGDEMLFALQDLFSNPEEEIEELGSNDVTALYEKEPWETVNNEISPGSFGGKGRRKGKHKGKKKVNRFEDLDLTESPSAASQSVHRFETLDECLQHFFEHERVTWRCAGEYPEKRVSFSKSPPEVFHLPPAHESRSGNWKSYLDDTDLPERSSSEEEEMEEEPSDALTEVTEGVQLKSCLKSKTKDTRPPVPALNSTKQYFLWRTPKVLCVHLKRFEANSHRRISKLNHSIQFESTLEVGHYMDINSPATVTTEYALRAVVCHSGSVGFGHYTAYVSRIHEGGTQWYDVSDSDVRKASVREVLQSQAYILLYEAPLK